MDSKDKRQLAKRRKETARQAQKFHREQQKQNRRSSQKPENVETGKSKIEDAINRQLARKNAERSENLTREEKFRREGEEKLRNLKPQDHEEGYYIDEYAEKQRQERRARQIHRQENEVIRRNKRPMTSRQIRLKHVLISAGLLAAVIAVGVILSLTVLFRTEHINVEGDIFYDRQQIIDFSNVAEQQNIFIGTWNSTPEEIVNNLPYVESAKISFSVPDTINITVKNAVPTYAISDGDGYLIVSSKGRILDVTNYKTDDLVDLKCGEITDKTEGSYIDFGDETVYDILHSVAKSFADYGAENVTGFDITNLSSIIITYDNRININIGLPEDIEYKIKTAFTIINEKLDPNHTGTVAGTLDVSTCNKNKISRYKPSPTAATTEPPATEAVEDYTQSGGDAQAYPGSGSGSGGSSAPEENGGSDDDLYGGNAYDWQVQ